MQKKPLKRVALLSGIGIQMAVTVFIGAKIGLWLDETYPISEKKLYTLLFTLAFTGIALYSVLKQVNKLNKD